MIYIVSDHGGYELKNQLTERFSQQDLPFQDLSKNFDETDDYPDAAQVLADFLLADTARDVMSVGVAICRSGQGMCMSLNRFKWIRAGFANMVEEVIMMRQDNDANVMCLGADFVSIDQASEMVDKFIQTPFSDSPRHLRRVNKLDKLG